MQRKRLALKQGKEFIEKQIGHPAKGLRASLLALDWFSHTSRFAGTTAGFQYDTSIAWKNSGGFGGNLPAVPTLRPRNR